MLYMVIEIYKNGPEAVYDRASTCGRMLPAGLDHVDSWVEAGKLDRCFQLMQTEDPSLFEVWRERWADLVDFEIVPIVTSSEASSTYRRPPIG